MKSASAFSPCNITGFFRIHDLFANPLKVGSTGAGVALASGVTTRVRLIRTGKPRFHASFNGRPLGGRSVSRFVANKYAEFDDRTWRMDINHTSQLPTGCGYGTSGAGALSLSLALNQAMNLSFSRIEASQIAHVSEVMCRTGLGTVTSAFLGGLTLRTIPGAPGIGQASRIRIADTQHVVTATFGPVRTRSVLSNDVTRARINSCSYGLLHRIDRRNPRTSFMSVSREFSDCLGLMSKRLFRLINMLDSSGFRSSMAMLGESLFCIVPTKQVTRVASYIRHQGPTPIISRISISGAHLL